MSIFKKIFWGSDTSDKKSDNRRIDIDQLLSSDDINGSVIELDNCIRELCSCGADLNKLTEEQAWFYYNQFPLVKYKQ